MTQILAQAGPYALTKTWYVDGTPTDVGTVTVGVVDGNGDTIVASGTATTNNGDGTYSYSLADQPNPDELVVTWTRTDTSADLIDRIEVVGRWLFTENQARTFSAKADAAAANIPLASATEYTDPMIADERSRITDELEQWTGRGWVTRYCRLELQGHGSTSLNLNNGIPRTSDGYALHRPGRLADIGPLLTVTINGTAQTVSNYEIDPRTNRLISTSGVFSSATVTNPFNVSVEYVYGMNTNIDGVDRIGLKLLVDRLVPSAFPDRALTVDSDFGTTRLVQPGGPMRNVSRLPEVNDWVMRHDHRILVA